MTTGILADSAVTSAAISTVLLVKTLFECMTFSTGSPGCNNGVNGGPFLQAVLARAHVYAARHLPAN